MIPDTARGVFGKVAGAVIPEADVVEVLDAKSLGGRAGAAIDEVDVGDAGSHGIGRQAGQVED